VDHAIRIVFTRIRGTYDGTLNERGDTIAPRRADRSGFNPRPRVSERRFVVRYSVDGSFNPRPRVSERLVNLVLRHHIGFNPRPRVSERRRAEIVAQVDVSIHARV